MEGNGGRNGRRNDSISSVMSLGADNNNAPATNQRSSRAENTHLQDLDHQASVHMLSQYASHDPSFMDSSGASDTDQSMDMMSDQDIRNAIFELLDQLPITANTDLITPYERAAMLPPVTQDSLCELDVGRIINNPKLRHDVNFDRELHFRPNLDGYRGKQKLRSADEFWSALRAELEIYKAIGYRLMYSTSAEELEEATRMIKANQLRLPGVFTTIYEILKTLVPERDQAVVAERLDVDMIMQQITKGVFDLMDMTRWLSTILKAHCAPMRDEWIDRMVDDITTGVEQGDQTAVVFGLRQTLAILEAMKLDVANHQIRHLRSLLIDDTVNFQQKYHVHKIAANRFKVSDARAWFKDEEAFLNSCNVPCTPLETFASAALRSLFSQSPLPNFPGTFYLDAERLRILRSDLHNVIQMDMCVNAFDLLIKNNVSASTRVASKKTLQANIADIIGEPRQYLENLENISAEIVRFVLQLEGATTTFDSDMIAIVELHLRAELSPSSPSLSAQLQTILNAQLPRFRNAVNSSSRLPLLALHDAMLPPVQSADKRTTQQVMVEPPLDEILKRVTHLAVLHWHVWSGIVYDIQADGPMVAPGSPGNNPDSPQTNPDTASSSSLASSPDMQSQSGGFAKHTGPSITNGRPQK